MRAASWGVGIDAAGALTEVASEVQGTDAKEEIVEDLSLRMISKEFLDTLKAVCLQQDEEKQRRIGKSRGKGAVLRGKTQFKPSPLWRFGVSQPSIAKPLLLVLSNAVVYPDSGTQAVALELLAHLLPSIAGMPKLLPALSSRPWPQTPKFFCNRSQPSHSITLSLSRSPLSVSLPHSPANDPHSVALTLSLSCSQEC